MPRPVAHVTFNPAFGTPSLPAIQQVCIRGEDEGWALLRVVPVNAYEAVAVFEQIEGGAPNTSPDSPGL